MHMLKYDIWSISFFSVLYDIAYMEIVWIDCSTKFLSAINLST